MPMDEYDSSHCQIFDKIVDVYIDDDIQTIVDNFFNNNETYDHEYRGSISSQMFKCITNMRASLPILDHRYITSISSRICYHYVPTYKWCLINVRRSRRPILICEDV